MQRLIIFMLVVVTTVDFLQRSHLLPGIFGYLPELIGASALLYVVTAGVRTRFQNIAPLYFMIFGSILFVILCGVLVNAVQPGPIFTGIRNFMRAIPLFLLPAIYTFNDKQLSAQLRVMLGICLIQLPLAVYQKSQPNVTGDSIYGTLMISSIMSMFLICSTCVVIGLYLRGRIRLPVLVLLCALLLAPATINETKGTLLLFPIAAGITFVVGARAGARLKNALIATAVLFAFTSAFVAAYDYTQRDRPNRQSIVDFFTGDQVDNYMESGRGFTNDRKEIRRMDTLKVTYGYLARDPIHLAFGLGMGNASDSALGIKFQGKYRPLFNGYQFLTGVRLLTEIGVLGLALVYMLLLTIWRDALVVARDDKSLTGAIAAGWLGVVIVMCLGMFYKDIMATNVISYLFWYFSGVVVARRMALDRQRSAKPVTAAAGTRVSPAVLAQRAAKRAP